MAVLLNVTKKMHSKKYKVILCRDVVVQSVLILMTICGKSATEITDFRQRIDVFVGHYTNF